MLSTTEIKKFIDDDISSIKKRKAAEGQKYYEAKHDILNCRFFYYNKDNKLVEDNFRANNKICHPFFTELSDQLVAHMLSFDENPIRAKEKVDGLQDFLDSYFDEDFWSEVSELISGTYNKGFEYIYCYKNTEDKLVFECSDSMGVVEVREKESSDKQKYIIYWYIDRIDKNNKIIKKIQVWSDKEVTYFQQVNSGQIVPDSEMNPNTLPHVVFTDETNDRKGYSFGFIPFFRLDLNRKQISGLNPIKALIDDYDIMQCGLSNNIADFDTPIHIVKGFEGDDLDELQVNLKTKKVVGVDEEGDIDIKTVNIPYQARQAKAADDEKNIYRFGMGLNTAGLKDTSATTNLAIKAAYALLDMKADKLEIRLKNLLKKIVKIVLDEINEENKKDYQLSDIEFKFTRSTLSNDTENITNEKTKADTEQVRITTILNIAASVGEEQTLKAICEVMDWDFKELQSQMEKMKADDDLQAAKTVLDSVEPTEPIEEPTVTE